ncbi:MAG TPA: triose-phosphate isomerase [Candidatus Paceibacterota bacterium]|nr:triose-phosphate isomerase [Candidatus Paceibacterota bacterium]
MNRKKIVIGNWKMNPAGGREAETMFRRSERLLGPLRNIEAVICPPFIYLENLKKISRKIKLGAQDAFWGDKGPFTGEVSAEMLGNLGAKYVIVGHSERRALGESDDMVNKKLKGVLAAGLSPVVCVGELSRDNRHQYFDTVKAQIRAALAGVPKTLFHKVIVAYEPVWAISSTKNRRDATPKDSLEMAIYIRKVLSDMSSPPVAASVRIIYGGSVTEKDAGEFLKSGGVVGLLPGRASLTPEKFAKIVKIAEDALN